MIFLVTERIVHQHGDIKVENFDGEMTDSPLVIIGAD